jgi:type III secretion protein U
MSESSEQKTELPSPKKKRDARAKGQVAKSQEVVTTISIIAVMSTVWFTTDHATGTLIHLLDQMALLAKGEFSVNAPNAITIIFNEATKILLPVILVVILAGIAGNYIQTGSIFAFESIKPKLSNISPEAGIKRIFSTKQVFELLKSILKITFLSILLFFVIRRAIGSFIVSVHCGLPCETIVAVTSLQRVLLFSAFAFILVAGFDFAYQRHRHIKSLMMSKQEVKREHKETEIDPHLKSRRKQLAHEFIMGDSGARARQGTAVVINPTHLAIVLHYDASKIRLPMVTAKGIGNHAHFLRTEAEKAGVPVFRNVSLARTLYATADVDEYVPYELFDVVAEVLVWVTKHRELLYKGPLDHGVIDMDAGDHRPKIEQRA